jgi:hypothetical protein
MTLMCRRPQIASAESLRKADTDPDDRIRLIASASLMARLRRRRDIAGDLFRRCHEQTTMPARRGEQGD